MPMASFRKWAGSGASDGRAEWSRALFVMDRLGLPGLEDAYRKLQMCVRKDSAAPITFSTIHSSKGLSWPSVVVLNDWSGESGPTVAKLCYVALTRAEDRLVIPTRLQAKLY